MTVPPPQFQDAALLTIDVQNDFVLDGPAQVPGTAAVLPAMVTLAAAFRALGRPIVHAIRLYQTDGSDAEPFRAAFVRSHAPVVAPNTRGAELAPNLAPSAAGRMDAEALYAGRLVPAGNAEWLMYKPRWSAFYKTPLEEHLRALAVRRLVVCGCNFPNCPRATIFDASERDFDVTLAQDATSQVTAERVSDLARIGVATATVQDFLARL
jgi:nicotinamidase-related amidase